MVRIVSTYKPWLDFAPRQCNGIPSMDKVERIVPRVHDPSLHHCLGPHTLEEDSVVVHGIYWVFQTFELQTAHTY